MPLELKFVEARAKSLIEPQDWAKRVSFDIQYQDADHAKLLAYVKLGEKVHQVLRLRSDRFTMGVRGTLYFANVAACQKVGKICDFSERDLFTASNYVAFHIGWIIQHEEDFLKCRFREDCSNYPPAGYGRERKMAFNSSSIRSTVIPLIGRGMPYTFTLMEPHISGCDGQVFASDDYEDVKAYLAKEWVIYAKRKNIPITDREAARDFAAPGRYVLVNYGNGCFVRDIFMEG